ncbi:MAG: uroporphyrinogen-III C-methyltransferase [Comamonadaceae bacterium CG12_big_fil_rev_8_21_14_0_65_59_15]|nr:MAG: uroporphyrinogen-III C-methyltransferase [Comamonadaceae bacterium CG12_big_fil_rev_8_21_14_0_65_59_15]
MTHPSPPTPGPQSIGHVIHHNALPTQRSLTSTGHCTLVGAGPGDPDLLTIKALKAIQSASVLLVDDLVSPEIVALARPGTRVVWVGKRGGCRSTPQAFIEKLILMAVREGEHVVRLKGGDPFVFGRGGEEMEHLQAAGVAVSVVNGITAGLAAVTSLGAPLTHRDHARGVIFVTGHASPYGQDTDWLALAQAAHTARLTLVIYMGVRAAEPIQQALLQGLDAHTPVAIVQNASLPEQRHALCRLDQMRATMVQQQLGSPSVIVIGDVLQGLFALQTTSDASAGANRLACA